MVVRVDEARDEEFSLGEVMDLGVFWYGQVFVLGFLEGGDYASGVDDECSIFYDLEIS